MAVVRNMSRDRFEIVDVPAAFLQYAERNKRIRLVHTEVPFALRGKGYASELARAALDYAREARLKVEVECPFVRAYLAKHTELGPLVPSSPGNHRNTEEEEQRHREAALDETLAESFPASDPLSTDPNPDAHDLNQTPATRRRDPDH